MDLGHVFLLNWRGFSESGQWMIKKSSFLTLRINVILLVIVADIFILQRILFDLLTINNTINRRSLEKNRRRSSLL
jgi:hypothetical protein